MFIIMLDRGDSMIFIAGIHGVGKSYFIDKVKQRKHIDVYTASKLIEEYKRCTFLSDKKIKDIPNNQKALLEALRYKGLLGKNILLNGHFCLLDENGSVIRINKNTYFDLNISSIVLLTEDVDIVVRRRRERDGLDICIESTEKFQNEEKNYAKEIAELLGVPLYINQGEKGIEGAIDFVINSLEGEEA